MSVIAKVVEIDFSTKEVTVEAYSNNRRILRSPMHVKGMVANGKDATEQANKNKEVITKELRKELKAFTGKLWGGLDIQFCVKLGG